LGIIGKDFREMRLRLSFDKKHKKKWLVKANFREICDSVSGRNPMGWCGKRLREPARFRLGIFQAGNSGGAQEGSELINLDERSFKPR
jgi:hypothetical protein